MYNVDPGESSYLKQLSAVYAEVGKYLRVEYKYSDLLPRGILTAVQQSLSLSLSSIYRLY
jgi:hypothetical protein